jgi:predicted dinucleotide-binding enzyme
MGSALAKKISKGNYRMLLYSSKTNAVLSLLHEIKRDHSTADAELVVDITEACWEADVIILTVPYTAEKEVAEKIRSVVNQKAIISTSNPFNDHYHGLLTSNTSAAEELQMQLPNAKVVKAFNTVLARDFENPEVNDLRIDCFIAGNDENALETVYDLVKTAGFNPVVAGDLSVSRMLENMQLLLAQLTMQNNYQIAGWKILHN